MTEKSPVRCQANWLFPVTTPTALADIPTSEAGGFMPILGNHKVTQDKKPR